jgi:drug/metabolite transporter (DMT)-like permease
VLIKFLLRFRHVTNVLLFVLAIYAAIYGVTYGYQLHYLANIVATWLVAVHFACSTITLQGLSQMLGEESEEGDVKKRP